MTDRCQHQNNNCPAEVPAITQMRSLVLIYHEDFEDAINGIVRRGMGVSRYTKIQDVVGARTETMQEMDYQPSGRNHMLIIVADCETVCSLACEFRELRKAKGHGLRGYVTPVEEII